MVATAERGGAHMLLGMVPEAHRLHAALVAAFPGYMTAAFAERGYPLDRTSVEAIEEATIRLEAALGAELELPYREQRRGPLELFRTAVRDAARVLEERGIAPLQTSGLMGGLDPYGLVPGSPSVLGDEAHEAHLAWGTAKAAAFVERAVPSAAPPTIVVVAGDRASRGRLVDALSSPGVVAFAARNPAAVDAALSSGPVVGAVVDLDHRAGRAAIDLLTGAGVTTYVFGEHIDDLTETGLLAQGVRRVVEKSELLDDPARYFPLIT